MFICYSTIEDHLSCSEQGSWPTLNWDSKPVILVLESLCSSLVIWVRTSAGVIWVSPHVSDSSMASWTKTYCSCRQSQEWRWVNDWLYEWMNEWMNEWTNERTKFLRHIAMAAGHTWPMRQNHTRVYITTLIFAWVHDATGLGAMGNQL